MKTGMRDTEKKGCLGNTTLCSNKALCDNTISSLPALNLTLTLKITQQVDF